MCSRDNEADFLQRTTRRGNYMLWMNSRDSGLDILVMHRAAFLGGLGGSLLGRNWFSDEPLFMYTGKCHAMRDLIEEDTYICPGAVQCSCI